MKYPLTFCVDTLPNGKHGATQGPIIRILKSKDYDVGLYQHELMHVKQWWCTLSLHSFLYLLSDEYKLWAEVQAYKKQLCYSVDREKDRWLFASFISTRYKLNLSVDEAYERLA